MLASIHILLILLCFTQIRFFILSHTSLFLSICSKWTTERISPHLNTIFACVAELPPSVFFAWPGLACRHPADQWPFPKIESTLILTSSDGLLLPILLWNFFLGVCFVSSLLLLFSYLSRSQASRHSYKNFLRKPHRFFGRLSQIFQDVEQHLLVHLSVDLKPLSLQTESTKWLLLHCFPNFHFGSNLLTMEFILRATSRVFRQWENNFHSKVGRVY